MVSSRDAALHLSAPHAKSVKLPPPSHTPARAPSGAHLANAAPTDAANETGFSSVGRDAASALVARISALGGVLSGTFAPQGGGVARFVADVSDVARSGQLEMVALVASLATAWLVCCACACTFCKRRRRRPTPSRGPSRRRQRLQRRIVPVVEDLEEW
eukprot:scaffold1192_cov101-Isochrysis_galbana.AAC.1